jgi:hypothetical protein
MITYLLIYLLNYLIVEIKSFIRRYPVLRLLKNSPSFMEPEGPLPRSQVPANCPYPEPDKFSPCPLAQLPEDPS